MKKGSKETMKETIWKSRMELLNIWAVYGTPAPMAA